MTEFQKRVYDALLQIPEGKVSTYSLLANYLSCHSAQAIGQALKKNPDSPRFPCHRIIKSNLTVGGFFGQTGGEHLQRKVELLKNEGVEFNKNGCLLEEERVFHFH